MISIAICDDDYRFTGYMDTVLEGYRAKSPYTFDISAFFDGRTLLDSVAAGSRYDIILLDIRMKEMDGIRAAKEIRRLDDNALLIYISGHSQYLPRLLDVRPYGFLDKPLNPHTLCKTLDSALHDLNLRQIYFRFCRQRRDCKVLTAEILYFESNHNEILLHMENGVSCFHERLGTLEKRLADASVPFLRIHQSYLVNYHAIRAYCPKRVELCDGCVLPISTERRKTILGKYHSLLEGDS